MLRHWRSSVKIASFVLSDSRATPSAPLLIYRRGYIVSFPHRIRLLALAIPCAAVVSLLPSPARAQKQISGEVKIRLAIEELNNVGSVMMIAAHPDDENTALLAYLSRGRHVRTAYLSLTRGEGGQNLIGPEQGDELGVIRTQELLAARRIDGAQQVFTRAIDFGFTNTPQ